MPPGSTVLEDRGGSGPVTVYFRTALFQAGLGVGLGATLLSHGGGGLTGKPEMKQCWSLSHAWHGGGYPVCSKRRGQGVGQGYWPFQSRRHPRRWLCSLGVGSGTTLFGFLCGVLRSGWAGRLSLTSAEHVFPHAGKEAE